MGGLLFIFIVVGKIIVTPINTFALKAELLRKAIYREVEEKKADAGDSASAAGQDNDGLSVNQEGGGSHRDKESLSSSTSAALRQIQENQNSEEKQATQMAREFRSKLDRFSEPGFFKSMILCCGREAKQQRSMLRKGQNKVKRELDLAKFIE